MAIEKKKKGIPKIEKIFANMYLTNLEWFDMCYQVDNLENYFSSDNMKRIIADVNDKYREYGRIPSFDDLSTDYALGEIATIEDIRDLEFNVNPDSFKVQIEKYFKHNAFIKRLQDNMKDFNLKNVGDIDENLDRFSETIKEVIDFNMARKTRIVDGADGLEFMDRYLAESVNPENMLRSGYPAIDEVMGGGFIRKTMTAIVAGTHVGKTLVKTNIAMNMAEDGKDILYVPLEMSCEEMHRRMFARVLQEATIDINVESWEKQKELVTEWYAETVTGSIRFAEYSVKELTSVMLENLCKEYKKIYGKFPDGVYIDSGNLMLSRLTNANSHDQGEDVANDLKGISQRCNTAVIVSLQLNREGIAQSKNHGESDMTKIAGSIYWIQVADNGLIMTLDPDDPNSIMFKFEKNRNTGICDKYVYLKRNTKFQDVFDTTKIVKAEKSLAKTFAEDKKEVEEVVEQLW